VFGTLLFWYLGFSVFWYSGSSTPYVRFIGSINFIPILLRRERHARHDPLVVTPNPRLKKFRRTGFAGIVTLNTCEVVRKDLCRGSLVKPKVTVYYMREILLFFCEANPFLLPSPNMWRPANADRRCTKCRKFFPSARAWYSRLNHVDMSTR